MTVQFEEPMTRVERRDAQAPRSYKAESTVAMVWLAMYVLIAGVAVGLPIFAKTILVAAN